MNRDNKGRFARSGIVKWFFIGIIIANSIVWTSVWYRNAHPKIVINTVTIDNSDKNFAQKIDGLEKSLVEGIHQCERQNYTEADGLVTFDPTDAQYANVQGKRTFVNKGEFSFGTYQFKISTVQFYYKKFYNQVITGKEAILIALDDNKAAQLTQDILFKTTDGWTNWKNCSTNLKLVDQINAIKKIK